MQELTARASGNCPVPGERHVARVIEARAGNALCVELGYTVLPVTAHLESVGHIRVGDRVLIDLLEEGVIVSGRLRMTAPSD